MQVVTAQSNVKNSITYVNNSKQKTVVIADAERAFSNNFICNKAAVIKAGRRKYIHAIITCTADSLEPARKYYCVYTLQHILVQCNTLN